MWHEARKQEKMIRGLIVDYRRRAERRKDFYEKIKADPTQFLQIHGRPCKIHLDPAVAAAGEGPAIMMQWQGDPSNMIDRFDVRAHLDYIADVKVPEIPPEELGTEERHCNYERYRILAQNAFLGMGEDKFLQQLAIEEQFGVTLEEKEVQREKLNEKRGTGVAIGYNYSDPGAQPSSSNGMESKKMEQKDRDSDDDSDLEILDVDLSIDVNKMEPSQAHELNAVGPYFGMAGCDLFSFLTGDADDAEHQKQLLIEEKEKAMYSGRKSRRERRAHRDKKLATRIVSPPSYAAPALGPDKSPSRSASRSPETEATEQIEFITSFGGEDDELKTPTAKVLYSEKLKQNLKKTELYSAVARKQRRRSPISEESYPCPIGPRGPNSRSRSLSKSRSSTPARSRKSRSRSRKSRSRSRQSRSRSRKSRSRSCKSRSRSRSRSRKSRSRSYISRSRSSGSHSRSSSYRRSRSRSRSRNYRSRRSRSPNYSKRIKSRSMSYDSGSDKASKAGVPRYYGRKKEDRSSSELSLDSGSSDSEVVKNKLPVGNKCNANQNQFRSSGSSSKGPSRETLSLKEKLKKKMQAQLSRQLRADKRAEAEREERESRRQARRDEEMRELAIKLRRKQREMRHRFRRSSDESDRSRSRSSSRDSAGDKKPSRSETRSPHEKRPPVWEKDAAPYKANDPPLPLPPLNTPPPPFVRKRNDEENAPKPYYPSNKIDNRSSSPSRRIPVWEAQREPYKLESSYPDTRKPRYQEEEYKYDSFRRYDNRFDQNHQGPYDNRWDSNRRRPYGNRGAFRGYSRPPLPPGVTPHWQRDQDCDENDDYDKSKVKLVDY